MKVIHREARGICLERRGRRRSSHGHCHSRRHSSRLVCLLALGFPPSSQLPTRLCLALRVPRSSACCLAPLGCLRLWTHLGALGLYPKAIIAEGFIESKFLGDALKLGEVPAKSEVFKWFSSTAG